MQISNHPTSETSHASPLDVTTTAATTANQEFKITVIIDANDVSLIAKQLWQGMQKW